MTQARTKVYPTGKCFDDAAELIDSIVSRYPEAMNGDEYLLVHAICLMPDTDEPFAHAWVETGGGHGMALFRGIIDGKTVDVGRPVDVHYAALRPRKITKYTVFEVYEENLKHKTYGPWKPEYLEFCR